MAKFRLMKGVELNECYKALKSAVIFQDDVWYKVEKHFDRIVGFFYRVVDIYENLPGTDSIDMFRYIKNKKSEKVGVFVGINGLVGWSIVHPKDRKNCVINWEFSKALAISRARAVTSNFPACADWPTHYGLYDQLILFADKYSRYLKNKAMKKQFIDHDEKKATWVQVEGTLSPEHSVYSYKCSFCGIHLISYLSSLKNSGYFFCPGCGAKMKAEEK